MIDVEKSNMQHETNARRTRRRKRGMGMYVFTILLLAVGTIVTLSMTVFFNIKTIRVTGIAESYSAEDIVAASGIKVGDNLVRLDKKEAEVRALNALIKVESVTIHKQFPNTVEIEVQKCTPAYNVSYEFGTLIVSEHGRILENTMDPMPGLVKIVGYEPKEKTDTPGMQIVAKEERMDKVFDAFRDLIYEGSLGVPIVEIDMSDFNDIMVNFDNRIKFDMGNWSEIDYKISFAEQIIAEQPTEKEGYLIMVGRNQCAFRNKADYEASRRRAEQGFPEVTPTESTEPVTDENGDPVEPEENPDAPEIPEDAEEQEDAGEAE
ncbi:MAG: FtsQ-type POTRA domain-containing protein [Oscillospiraceae bacterium]|nr:FtsQ-type POTRA domain-containing protein [Oscillospiraceae bacterium]